jgi:carbon monoxide dehydrogenase subunit G
VKFEHLVRIHGTSEALWSVLGDFPRVAKLMPGVERVVERPDGTYLGKLSVRVGPIGLSMDGNVELDHNTADGEWHMRAHADDKRIGGAVRAVIDAYITSPTPDAAELRMIADVQFLGRLGQLGAPVIKHKADQMIKEFAENLQKAVHQAGQGAD